MVVALEHRYYGESNPCTDYSTDSLKYLSSAQALADAAYFLENFINVTHKDDDIQTVIVIGGSYTGSMSAWFRMMYPHLVIGSIASSAPVYLKEDFNEYDEHIAGVLNNYSTTCRTNIMNAMDEITVAIGGSDDSSEESGSDSRESVYQEYLNTTGCTGISDHTDFLYVLADAVAGAVQYNDFNGATMDDRTIELMCNIMENTSISSLTDRMFAFLAEMLRIERSSCMDFSSSYEKLSDTTLDPESSGRQWMYQSCLEFGYFQIASSDDSTRTRSTSIDLEYHERLCSKLFDGLEVNITPSQIRYQQDDMMGTNIIWVNGGVLSQSLQTQVPLLSLLPTAPILR